jgi:hypothetical protein
MTFVLVAEALGELRVLDFPVPDCLALDESPTFHSKFCA